MRMQERSLLLVACGREVAAAALSAWRRPARSRPSQVRLPICNRSRRLRRFAPAAACWLLMPFPGQRQLEIGLSCANLAHRRTLTRLTQPRHTLVPQVIEIGRASCRERVANSESTVAGKKKKKV